jgi:hypothetical protein
MGMGDYEQLQREFQPANVTAFVTSTDDYSATPLALIAARAADPLHAPNGYELMVQKVTFSVTTPHASFGRVTPTTTTASVVAEVDTATVPGPVIWDFGTRGLRVPTGEGLQYTNEAVGMALAIVIQAYWKPVENS